MKRARGLPTRGFGYWCWKPKVILMALEQIQMGNLLIYCDIGFEFNAKAKNTLQELFSDIEANEIMGSIMDFPEKEWNKADLLAHFGLLEDREFLESGQCAAGIVLLKKTQKTIQIMQEWLEVFYKHFELIDDSPSTIPNLPEFRENRHDQSVWSVLNKKYKVKKTTLIESGLTKVIVCFIIVIKSIYPQVWRKQRHLMRRYEDGDAIVFSGISKCIKGVWRNMLIVLQ